MLIGTCTLDFWTALNQHRKLKEYNWINTIKTSKIHYKYLMTSFSFHMYMVLCLDIYFRIYKYDVACYFIFGVWIILAYYHIFKFHTFYSNNLISFLFIAEQSFNICQTFSVYSSVQKTGLLQNLAIVCIATIIVVIQVSWYVNLDTFWYILRCVVIWSDDHIWFYFHHSEEIS